MYRGVPKHQEVTYIKTQEQNSFLFSFNFSLIFESLPDSLTSMSAFFLFWRWSPAGTRGVTVGWEDGLLPRAVGAVIAKNPMESIVKI